MQRKGDFIPLMCKTAKQRAPRNRTLALSESERISYARQLLHPPLPKEKEKLLNQIVCDDAFVICAELPRGLFDLLILDPPYNTTKIFGSESFRGMTLTQYEKWFDGWFSKMLPTLKSTATLYVCGDWRSSTALHRVLDRYVIVRNRITSEAHKERVKSICQTVPSEHVAWLKEKLAFTNQKTLAKRVQETLDSH